MPEIALNYFVGVALSLRKLVEIITVARYKFAVINRDPQSILNIIHNWGEEAIIIFFYEPELAWQVFTVKDIVDSHTDLAWLFFRDTVLKAGELTLQFDKEFLVNYDKNKAISSDYSKLMNYVKVMLSKKDFLSCNRPGGGINYNISEHKHCPRCGILDYCKDSCLHADIMRHQKSECQKLQKVSDDLKKLDKIYKEKLPIW